MHIIFRRSFLVLTLSVVGAGSAMCVEPSSFDESFGTSGKVSIPVAGDTGSDYAGGVILGSDGRVFVLVRGSDDDLSANTFVGIAAMNPDGSMAGDFGTNGIAKYYLPAYSYGFTFTSFAKQEDGKFVAVGYGTRPDTDFYQGGREDFLVVRFQDNGAPDTSFGVNGLVVVNFVQGNTETITPSSMDRAHAVAIQADGKIVVAGLSDSYAALVRLNSNGSLDGTFQGGTVRRQLRQNSSDVVYSLVLQPDGKIVVGGNAWTTTRMLAIARFHADGTLDTSFGDEGVFSTLVGPSGNDSVRSLALQPDGKIVGAGLGYTGSGYGLVLVRLHTNGMRDIGFGDNGTVFTSVLWNQYANSLAIQKNGRIVVAGGNLDLFVVARYESNGSLDQSFSGNGFHTFSGGIEGNAEAVCLQPDGKILVAGYGNVSNSPPRNANTVVFRLTGDGPNIISFSSLGRVRYKKGRTVSLDGAASSGLAVEYHSSNPKVAVVDGDMLRILGVGKVMITASQTGNAIHDPADPAMRKLVVLPGIQKIFFKTKAKRAFKIGKKFRLKGKATSGLRVIYTSSNPDVLTVSRNIVTMRGKGKAKITAKQGGGANYKPAAPVRRKVLLR